MVLLRGSFTTLLWLAALAAPVGVFLYLRFRDRLLTGEGEPPAPSRSAFDRREVCWRAGFLGVALAVCANYAYLRNLPLFVALSTLLLAGAVLLGRRMRFRRDDSPEPAHPAWLMWLLSAVCVVIVLFLHAPSTDDTLYVNMAVGAVDHPHAPLLAQDRMFGIQGVPLMLPVYRFHAFELLGALLARVTGISALAIFHLVLAAAAGALIPLALRELNTALLGRRWVWGVLATLAFLALDAESRNGLGQRTLIRVFNGKGVFLTVLVPLLIAYSVRYARGGGRRAWMLLAAAQITSVGLTSTAIWVAPLIVGLTVVATAAAEGRGVRRLLAGVSSAFYPVLVGCLVASETRAVLARVEQTLPAMELQLEAQFGVLGYGHHLYGSLAILLGTWSLCRSRAALAFSLVLPLFFFLVLFNPLLAGTVIHSLTGARTYWRVFWIVPMPIFVGLAVGSIESWPLLERFRTGGRSLLLVGSVLLLGLLLRIHPGNAVDRDGMWVSWPGLKVPDAYRVARMLNRSVRPESRVLAPEEVGIWVTVMHNHAYPLVTKLTQIRGLSAFVGDEECERRACLARYVGGDPVLGDTEFRSLVEYYSLAGVVLRTGTATTESARRVLEELGFRLHDRPPGYEVWVRAGG